MPTECSPGAQLCEGTGTDPEGGDSPDSHSETSSMGNCTLFTVGTNLLTEVLGLIQPRSEISHSVWVPVSCSVWSGKQEPVCIMNIAW